MNQLKLFTYAEKYPFSVVLIDGDPHFVGKEICEALGYKNHNKAMGDHCRGVTKRYPLQTAGGMQETRVISEPDMLRLIISSELPSAQEFERWVFEDVLPSIRKTGSYGVLNAPQNFADALQLAADQQREIQRLALQAQADAPKVELANAIVADARLQNFTEVAKEFGVGRNKFIEILATSGWIYKRTQHDKVKEGPWLPRSDKEQRGLLVFKKRPDERGVLRDQTLITGKGIAALRGLFA